MKILLIGDTHFTPHGLKTYDQRLKEPFFSSLDREYELGQFDCVVFLGDAIDKAGSDFASIEMAYEKFVNDFMVPVIAHLGLSRERCLWIAGNHDVDRKKIIESREIELRSKLITLQTVDRHLELATEPFDDRLKTFSSIREEFYAGTDTTVTPLWMNTAFALDSVSFSLAGLCSAWRCSDDAGQILIGRRQVEEAIVAHSDANIRICAIHHPIEKITEFEQDDINGLIDRTFTIALFGDTHRSDNYSRNTTDGGSIRIAARSLNANESLNDQIKHSIGYTVVDLDEGNNSISVRDYVFDPEKDSFDIHRDDKYALNSDAHLDRFKTIQQTAAVRIVEGQEKTLIPSGTDSKAPTTISELFVHPPIVREEGDGVTQTTQTRVSVDGIRTSAAKVTLLVGLEGSGKTVILTKIFSDALRVLLTVQVVPIFLQFRQLQFGRLQRTAREQLGWSKSQWNDSIDRDRFILLVDDFPLDVRPEVPTDLKTILAKSNWRVVLAGSGDIIQGSLATAALGEEDATDSTYQLFEIKPWGHSEIEELAEKWFHSEYDETPRTVTDSAINSIIFTGLPSTPQSISFIFWIFETDRSYQPENEAVLVDVFLDRVFKKHEINAPKPSVLHYRNKKSLLASLAWCMVVERNGTFELDRNDVIDVFTSHLQKRSLSANPENELSEFLAFSILTESPAGISFRLSCFLHYFVMFHLRTHEKDFAQVLTSDEQVLRFADELVFLSGIDRRPEKILKACTRVVGSLIDDVTTMYTNDVIERQNIDGETDLAVKDRLLSALDTNVTSQRELNKRTDELLKRPSNGPGRIAVQVSQDPLLSLLRMIRTTSKILRYSDEMADPEEKKRILHLLVHASALVIRKLDPAIREVISELPSEERQRALNQLDFLLKSPEVFVSVVLQRSLSGPLSVVIQDAWESRGNVSKAVDPFEYYLESELFRGSLERVEDSFSHLRDVLEEQPKPWIIRSVLKSIAFDIFSIPRERVGSHPLLQVLAHAYCFANGLNASERGRIYADLVARVRKSAYTGSKGTGTKRLSLRIDGHSESDSSH